MIPVTFRPLLVSGMLADTAAGPQILIDSEQPLAEQNIAIWHELLHLIGLEDEAYVEACAQRLAETVPDLVTRVRTRA